jgi:hypothetical protein
MNEIASRAMRRPILPRSRLAAAVLACASSPTAYAPYAREVLSWLDSQGVAWRPLDLDGAWGPVVALAKDDAADSSCALAVHLLASPRRAAEVQPPWCNARLTEACSARGWPPRLVHLHEDVWRYRGEIVRARLLARCGRVRSRIFARKTVVRRIPAAEYDPFLDANHLWGATKAKYGYGLFLPTASTSVSGAASVSGGGSLPGDKSIPGSGSIYSDRPISGADGAPRRGSAPNSGPSSSCSSPCRLVAVATFSARRRVARNGRLYSSHELLRVCCARDGAVVGGISKLVRAFVRAHAPDDLVTVRDQPSSLPSLPSPPPPLPPFSLYRPHPSPADGIS